MLGGGILGAGVGVISYVAYDLLVDNPIDLQEQKGDFVISETSAVDQILINADVSTYLDNRTDPADREETEDEFRRVIGTCRAEMGASVATDVLTTWVQPFHAVEDQVDNVIKINGDWHQLCEFIPIYTPGAGTHVNGRPMREATVHIA